MPVLGQSSTASAVRTGGAGVRGLGFSIPAGSLDNLRTAFAAHASQLVELVYFGDSTGFGSGADGGPPRKLRSLLLAAGLTDGGRGVASPQETASSSGENLAPLVSKTGWAVAAHAYDFLNTDTPFSTTAGDTMTVTGKGTAIRLYATGGNSGGAFTYAVDGGTAVSTTSLSSGVTGDIKTVYISGLTEGTHTVTIVNTSGASQGIVAEFIRGAGVVVHKQAISGISMASFFSRTQSNNSTFANAPALAALGLQQRTGNSPANSMDYGLAAATKPTARNVPAAFLALGINNQTGTDDATFYTTLDIMEEGVGLFVRMCRQASIDPIVIVPHLVFASNAEKFSGRMRRALTATAEAHSCAWVDYNTALGPITSTNWSGAPHLTQTQADIEAQFLYDKVLALALPGA